MNKDMKEAFSEWCEGNERWEFAAPLTAFQAAWEIQQKRVDELLEDKRKMREFIEIVANDGEGQYQWSFTKSARLAKQILAQMGD